MTSKDRDMYNSPEYRSWRYHVMSRDKFTCQKCQARGQETKLEAHHIVKWSSNERLRFNVSNGICLCVACHNEVTGKEEKYQELFQTIVAQKVILQKERYGKKQTGNKTQVGQEKISARRKWRQINPWVRH